jgi:hypothetical protein
MLQGRRKWWILGIAAVVLIAVLGVVVSRRDRSVTSAQPQPKATTTTSITTSSTTTTSTTSTTTAPTALPPAAWNVTTSNRTGATGPTSWDVETFSVTENGEPSAVGATIEDTLNSQVDEFVAAEAAADPPPDVVFLRLIQTDELGNRYLTVTVNVSRDFNGSAHGTTTPHALTFDLTSGRVVDPLSLFRSKDAGLVAISESVRPRVFAYLDTDNADEVSRSITVTATEPNEDNYQTLILRPDGVLVRFHQYQIGSYALNMLDALAPWTEIDSALDPASIPNEWRRPAQYTTGYFTQTLDWIGELPQDATNVTDLMESSPQPADSGSGGGWLFATDQDGQVVVMQSEAEPGTWRVVTRGSWPLGCDLLPAPLLAAQGIDC